MLKGCFDFWMQFNDKNDDIEFIVCIATLQFLLKCVHWIFWVFNLKKSKACMWSTTSLLLYLNTMNASIMLQTNVSIKCRENYLYNDFYKYLK